MMYNDTTMEQQQQHLRRDNMTSFKRTIIVLMGITCVATVTTCFHASHYLQQQMASPPATGNAPSLPASASDSTGQSVVEHGPRVLPPAKINLTARRPRAIDSSSLSPEKGIPMVQGQKKKQLDFIIAGFPKTGTTSLLYAFGDHPETDIAPKERCAVTNPMVSDDFAIGKLQESLSELSASPNVKRAIKCPSAVYHAYNAIVRFEQHAPETKFVIGVRHPIEMLQSFYNYRITELYDRQKQEEMSKRMEKIPPIDRLIGVGNEWKGVSTDSTNFESYLMQFGKTNVEATDMQAMLSRGSNTVERKHHHWAVKPNSFSIFLYTLDQLEDTGDAQRSQSFRQGLQQFLGLQEPLKPVGRENLNHFVGKKAHAETVDICLPKYLPLRRILSKQGARSAKWIEIEFLKSRDVVVANKEHFLESIRSWSVDPCEAKIERGLKTRTHKTGAHRIETTQRNLSTLPQDKRMFVRRGRNIEVIPVKQLDKILKSL